MRCHPVDGIDDRLIPARAPAIEHPDGDELDALGDAVTGTADNARHVGTVAVAVLSDGVVLDEVVAGRCPRAEIRVRSADAAVDDVRVNAGTRRYAARFPFQVEELRAVRRILRRAALHPGPPVMSCPRRARHLARQLMYLDGALA
jgi:hypothetical protein